MMFRDKSISKFYAFALAAVFALTLAGCGGNGGGTAAVDDDMETVTPDPGVMEPEPDPETCPEGQTGTPPNCMTAQQVCEAADGRWNADDLMCTTAEQLAAAVMAATAAAGTKRMAIGVEADTEAAGDGRSRRHWR